MPRISGWRGVRLRLTCLREQALPLPDHVAKLQIQDAEQPHVMPGLEDFVPALRPGFVVGSPHQDGFIDRKSNRQDGSYEIDAFVADAVSTRASGESDALISVIEAKNAGQVREGQREGNVHVALPLILVLGVDRNVNGVSSLAKLADPTPATCSPVLALVDVNNLRLDVQVFDVSVARKPELTNALRPSPPDAASLAKPGLPFCNHLHLVISRLLVEAANLRIDRGNVEISARKCFEIVHQSNPSGGKNRTHTTKEIRTDIGATEEMAKGYARRRSPSGWWAKAKCEEPQSDEAKRVQNAM